MTVSPQSVNMTTSELAQKLASPRGGNRITVTLKTTPKLLKKGRESGLPYDKGLVTKVSTMHGMIGSDYSNGVNNQREREGVNPDFVPQSHKWATHLRGSLMTANKGGELVLALRGMDAKHTNKSVFFDGNDKEVTRESIAEFLPVPRSGSGSQGTDKEVVWVTPKLANVIGVRMDGIDYKIVNPKVLTFADVKSAIGSPKVASN